MLCIDSPWVAAREELNLSLVLFQLLCVNSFYSTVSFALFLHKIDLFFYKII